MIEERWKIQKENGTMFSSVVWRPEGEACALLQVTHGMTEHIGRYEALAKELTSHGIIVAGFDLRGHGENPGYPKVASFGEGGWEASIQDMRWFFERLGKRFPEIPHYMLGFSLGSFLLREYLGRYPEGVAGAAIVGTGYQQATVLSFMMSIVKGQGKKGFDKTTPLVRNLSFGMYNKKFKPNRTEADWLCADETQLDEYLADPLCRRDISSGLFWQLLDAMKRTGSKDACDNWNKDMPVLLLSGQDDPVGDKGDGVKNVCQLLMQAGLKKVAIELLPGARHDVFHEEALGAAAQTRKLLVEWMKG